MREVDVAIVGGGLAGASAAVMLARKGIDAVLIDPRAEYPEDFRCEKFDNSQVALLNKAGLEDIIAPVIARADDLWVARLGRLLDRKPNHQYCFRYEAVVNALRQSARETVPFLITKAESVETSDDRQIVRLTDGQIVSARLVILANGLNMRLGRDLGFEREVLSKCHSLSIGFDMEPFGKPHFPFRALTYFPESVSHRMAYITLFPVDDTMRANLFVYRGLDDPWLTRLREAPEAALAEIMPRLTYVTGEFQVTTETSVRPVDLYRTSGHRRGEIVLVGDAFSTSCPAAGTGANKVFTDVQRLCDVHLPQWLSTPGMGAAKIAEFYDDPVKTACEEASLNKAFLLKSLSLDPGLNWHARRVLWFLAHMGVGFARRARGRGKGGAAKRRREPASPAIRAEAPVGPASRLQPKDG